ncbi:MAG: catechol 2,3-dioxygenase-like lactoylglutathione lyase family enzyme [Arenicella sp.]|jgi:catechol 2,3-dioxygenase-like lactoylglutathione lyase family enzyme
MIPRIDHLQITVKDFEKAEAFYDKLMPILGFDLAKKSKGRVDANDFDVIEYAHPSVTIGINSPRKEFKNQDVHRRTPGSVHHLAFGAQSREEVDEVYPLIKAIGAEIVQPPQFYPQHGENYYALFFKDLDGIKLEVMFEEKA